MTLKLSFILECHNKTVYHTDSINLLIFQFWNWLKLLHVVRGTNIKEIWKRIYLIVAPSIANTHCMHTIELLFAFYGIQHKLTGRQKSNVIMTYYTMIITCHIIAEESTWEFTTFLHPLCFLSKREEILPRSNQYKFHEQEAIENERTYFFHWNAGCTKSIGTIQYIQ